MKNLANVVSLDYRAYIGSQHSICSELCGEILLKRYKNVNFDVINSQDEIYLVFTKKK